MPISQTQRFLLLTSLRRLFALCSTPYAFFRLSALCPLLFAAFLTSAQRYKLISPQYQIEPVTLNTSEDAGLFVNMLQDNQGYLWITTTKGILVFDGQESVLYQAGHPRFPMAINSGQVGSYSIKADGDGILYTEHQDVNKIAGFDPVQRRVIMEFQPASQITTPRSYFDVTADGQMYSLHWSKGSDTCSIWNIPNDSPHEKCFAFSALQYGSPISYIINDRQHWLQTPNGIWRISLDGKQSDFFKYPDQSLATSITPSDGANVFFTYTRNNAIYYWNSKMETPRVYATVPDGWIERSNQFSVDGHRAYLASALSMYVVDTLNKTWQDLSPEVYQLKAERVPGAMAEDVYAMKQVYGQLYILGARNLFRLTEKSPEKTMFSETLGNENSVYSMRGLAEDADHNVYASNYSGVYIKKHNAETFEPYLPVFNIVHEVQSAFSLNVHAGQLLWNTKSIDLTSGAIKDIGRDVFRGHVTHLLSGDTLWMYIWYTDKFYVYDLKTGVSDSVAIARSRETPEFPYIINDIVQDHDPSRMWLATRSDGIVLMDKEGKEIRSYTHADLNAGIDEGICDLYLDGDELWYGCLNGLGVLNIHSGEHLLYSNPVINQDGQSNYRTVFSILPDEHDGFYLGSSNGLLYFDRKKRIYSNLDENHPLAQNEYNRASAFMDSRGRYYFGTTDGLFSFVPDELVFSPAADTIGEIMLYGISIFNGNEKQYRYLSVGLKTQKHLSLRPSDTNIQFSFSVPEFEKTVYYRYRIAGLDEQWTAFSPDNRILLYSLPPGDYTLEVKASTGVTDESASSYTLGIHMPEIWYRKAWVIILMSLLFTGIVVALIRYRYQQKWLRQKALEKLRVSISSDLHDDVGSLLSGVAMQSQVMSFDVDEKHKTSMLELSAMSREAMERMRDTVWAIDARKDKYENLIDRMRDFAEKTLERKNITHEFITKDIDGKKFINPEVRQNIYLIFKEAITNVVKHSDGTHVRIELSHDVKGVQLVVHDNGTLHATNNSDGSGISNMEMRARKIGGTCEVRYEGGYRIQVRV